MAGVECTKSDVDVVHNAAEADVNEELAVTYNALLVLAAPVRTVSDEAAVGGVASPSAVADVST